MEDISFKIIFKHILLFIILIIVYYIINSILFSITNLLFFNQNDDIDIVIKNVKYINFLSSLIYLFSSLLSYSLIYKYWKNIINFFKDDYWDFDNNITSHFSILIIIPLIFSIILELWNNPLELDDISFMFPFLYWWISGNFLSLVIFDVHSSDSSKLIMFWIIKLLLVIFYTRFLWIENNKILYTITILLWIIWSITWYIFFWMLMSV